MRLDSIGGIGGKAGRLMELQRGGFPVPDFFCAPVDPAKVIEELGAPVIVRSSASVEDGCDVSFAGQFRSFLNLHTVEEVERAIRECGASVKAPAVRDYCRRHGIDPDSLRMTVMIQRMIQPELAGVAFTVNPVSGAEEVVIEACAGLADGLLAGHVAPLSKEHPLLLRYAGKIEETARRIQRYFGAPQDIEFAIERGELFILQARPITRISFAREIGEWTNADFRDGGVACGVCTPLMWSLYDFVWEKTLNGFLREIKLLKGKFQAGRMFFGRPYWNLGEVKKCLAKLPGFDAREFDRDLSVRVEYDPEWISTPVTFMGVIRALPTVFAIESLWKRQERFDRAFLAGGFDDMTRSFEQIPTAGLELQFRRLVEEVYWTTESNYFRTIYCASLAKMDFMRSFPDADYPGLVAGLPQLAHLRPLELWRESMARGESDIDQFIARFRHHSRRELDLRSPRWDEDRDWVERLLCESQGQPLANPRETYEIARAAALSELPWRRRRQFQRKLARLRNFLWLREEMRDLSSRVYYLIRRHVRAIAARKGLGDDIFFMSFGQILMDDRSSIERNREIFDSYRNFRAPNEIGARCSPPGAIEHTSPLVGIGASKGTARGIARVVRSVEEASQVEPGVVLVCPFTDPGWTPILGRVAGVITETGGLLSHAAVICREYGIPAVLAVPEATRRIKNRDCVVVRGDAGACFIANEHS